ncbi:MAG: twitching motility protein PilT [Lachnospiraceae bacterium]|nr:twitching motility protein PilT [Lachnospiraceae bacterium]
MVKLVLGTKGKGKTKYLLDNANSEAKSSDGVVIYLDKNTKHMFELDRAIRLINVNEYPVPDFEVLMGFICGLIAGNNDIEAIYFDSFLTLANLEGADPSDAIKKLIVLSEKLNVDFIVSLSMDEADLSENFKEYIVLSL